MENFHHHHHLHHHNHRHPSQFLHKPIPLLLNTSPALSSTSIQPSTSSSLMENFLTSTTTNSPSSLITGLNSHQQQQLAFDWHQHLTAAATAAAAAAATMAAAGSSGSSMSSSNCYAAFAGSDINADSKVYLLYEMPMALLAKRFYDSTKITHKNKIMVHEVNGCIVGPGMYQEWTSQIGAARNCTEQNLELCRSGSNNMLFYKATRRIKCGDQLLAWFSRGVELELVRSLLNRDFLVSPSSSSRHRRRRRRNRRLHRHNHHHSSYYPPLLADNPHDSAVADAVAAAPIELDDEGEDELEEEELDELEQEEQNHEDEKEVDETRCKRCLIDFEHINILKSHLMFDLCGRTTATPTTKPSSTTTITTATTMPMTTTPTTNYLDWSFLPRLAAAAHHSYKNHPTTSISTASEHINSSSSLEPILSRKFCPKSSIGSSSCSSTSSSCSTVSISSSSNPNQQSSLNDSSSVNHQTQSAFSPIKITRVKKSIDYHHQLPLLLAPPEIPLKNCSLQSNNRSPNVIQQQQQTGNSKQIIDSSRSSPPSIRSSPKDSIIKSTTSKRVEKDASIHKNSSGSVESTSNNSPAATAVSSSASNPNGLDWKITLLDGTQTVELNIADEMGKQKKTHVCLFCGKIYNRKYGLKIHLRTHTGYKPLKCKVCSRPFSDPSNLNKHVRLHSQGDTPYRCLYCDKILVRKRDLDRHILSRHHHTLASSSLSSTVAATSRLIVDEQQKVHQHKRQENVGVVTSGHSGHGCGKGTKIDANEDEDTDELDVDDEEDLADEEESGGRSSRSGGCVSDPDFIQMDVISNPDEENEENNNNDDQEEIEVDVDDVHEAILTTNLFEKSTSSSKNDKTKHNLNLNNNQTRKFFDSS